MSQVAHCSVDAQFSWERCEEVFWFNSDIRWPWWRISRWIKWYNCKRGNHKTCKPRLHITRLPPHQTQSIESGRGALVFMSNEMILGGKFIQCCCRTTRPQALAAYFQTFRPSAWALQPLKTAAQGLFLSVCVCMCEPMWMPPQLETKMLRDALPSMTRFPHLVSDCAARVKRSKEMRWKWIRSDNRWTSQQELESAPSTNDTYIRPP